MTQTRIKTTKNRKTWLLSRTIRRIKASKTRRIRKTKKAEAETRWWKHLDAKLAGKPNDDNDQEKSGEPDGKPRPDFFIAKHLNLIRPVSAPVVHAGASRLMNGPVRSRLRCSRNCNLKSILS